MAHQLTGRLVTPRGVVGGTLRFGSTINEIEENVRDEGHYILPGFIDTHVHGGGGGDTMDGAEGVRTLARFHAAHGTTTLYPTTITNPWERILESLHGVREVMHEPGLPSLPGVHLEGPFISPERLGAQPPHTLEPTQERLKAILDLNIIRLVTLAPEVPGGLRAARRFVEAGVRVSVGHTVASYEATRALVEGVREAGGRVGFTHLYNAMGGLEGRNPGVVGAALSDPRAYAELILDGHHVHEGSFLSALHAKPGRLYLVTDAIRATGLEEGITELGGQRVTVEGGAARLEDGTLAGSVLTLERALRNTVAAGVSVQEASRLVSSVPAAYMGLHDRGELTVDKRADLVILDEGLNVQEVYIAGERVR